MKKRVLPFIAAAFLTLAAAAGTLVGEASSELPEDDGKMKIGVAISSTTNTLGASCKKILDAAAAAFDIEIFYCDHGNQSELIAESVEQLCIAGCTGVICAGGTDEETSAALTVCEEKGVYFAQFFNSIDSEKSPELYETAKTSACYIGFSDESEKENGKTLVSMLIANGCRQIGFLMRDRVSDACTLELEGALEAIEEWNSENPEDRVMSGEPLCPGTLLASAQSSASDLLNGDPAVDGILLLGASEDMLTGVRNAVSEAGKTDSVGIVSDALIPGQLAYIGTESVIGGSGENPCTPLYAFMMVYQAISGDDSEYAGELNQIICPYLYAADTEAAQNYQSSFVEGLPYTSEDFEKMAGESAEQLQESASAMRLS